MQFEKYHLIQMIWTPTVYRRVDTGVFSSLSVTFLTSIDYFSLTNHTGCCKTNFPLKVLLGKVAYIIFCAVAAKFGPEM